MAEIQQVGNRQGVQEGEGQFRKQLGFWSRALMLNFVIGLFFLVPLKSWHSIISITSSLGVFTYAAGAISVIVFRRLRLTSPAHRITGMEIIAPLGFIISSLIIYWSGWNKLDQTIPIVLVGLVVYAIAFVRNRSNIEEIRGGIWIIVFLAVIMLISFLGSFHGLKLIAAPWDSVLVAVLSLGIYLWAVASGTSYLRKSDLRETLDDKEETHEAKASCRSRMTITM